MLKKNVPNIVKSEERIAFVISPIGDSESSERKRADQILKHVITPVVSEVNYKAIRADKISKPGIITTQVINHIIQDQLVIADLTGSNPNVFYELAIRHTLKKPVIQIIAKGEKIPFDISTQRTIQIDHKDLDSVEDAKKELRKQIEAVEKDPSLVDSPIGMAVDLQVLRQSNDPESKAIAEIKVLQQETVSMIKEIYAKTVGNRATQLLASALFRNEILPHYLFNQTAQQRSKEIDDELRNEVKECMNRLFKKESSSNEERQNKKVKDATER